MPRAARGTPRRLCSNLVEPIYPVRDDRGGHPPRPVLFGVGGGSLLSPNELDRATFLRSVGKTGAQLCCAQALGVRRSSRLMLASTLRERSGVDCVEADLVNQLRHRLLRLLVVARDRDAEATAVAGGTAVVAEARPEDRVERLDHPSTRQARFQ